MYIIVAFDSVKASVGDSFLSKYSVSHVWRPWLGQLASYIDLIVDDIQRWASKSKNPSEPQ